jgi:hypothetical protein
VVRNCNWRETKDINLSELLRQQDIGWCASYIKELL